MPTTTLSAREINLKYDLFAWVVTSNGIRGDYTEIRHAGSMKFGEVKKVAIETIKLVYERHHGRGEHMVQVYGMIEVDARTDEERRVGFPIRWERRVDGDPLFEL